MSVCKKCDTDDKYADGECKFCAREYSKKWKRDNPEKHRKHNRDHRQRHPGRKKERDRAWQIANPDMVRANKQRYRAKRRGSGGSFTSSEWDALCAKSNNACLSCGAITKLEADHVVPVSRNGTSNISNIQPLCRSCNARKGAMMIDYRYGPPPPGHLS